MKVMKCPSHLLIILGQPWTTQKAKGNKRLIEAQLYPLEISGYLPLYMVLGELLPYIWFWEGCSLIYVSLEGLSGKKIKGSIEAQLYPPSFFLSLALFGISALYIFLERLKKWALKHNCTQRRSGYWFTHPTGDALLWPLKHNCTQISEQTTDQGDEFYSFFGH